MAPTWRKSRGSPKTFAFSLSVKPRGSYDWHACKSCLEDFFVPRFAGRNYSGGDDGYTLGELVLKPSPSPLGICAGGGKGGPLTHLPTGMSAMLAQASNVGLYHDADSVFETSECSQPIFSPICCPLTPSHSVQSLFSISFGDCNVVDLEDSYGEVQYVWVEMDVRTQLTQA